MDDLDIHLEDRDDRLVLRLAGTLDGHGAQTLAEALRQLPLRPLTIDFSRVRTFVDLAIDGLTLALRGRPVRIVGVGRHQQRMFRYFGLQLAELAQPAEA